MRALVTLLAMSVLNGQALSDADAHVVLLARIRTQMAESLARQPNYTCLETVERTHRPRGGRSQVGDTLRLEVALVNGKELFAWPGSKVFEDKDLRDIVASGTFGNGNFAIHARTVFMGQGPPFTYRGEELLNGKPAVRWDFRVERVLSGYTLRVNEKEAIVGYRGSFWADPKTLDVRRLEVFVEDPPKELDVNSTADRVDYAKIPIGGVPFLLPVESTLDMSVRDIEYRNFTRFTSCRQYSGESILKFTEEVTPGAAPAPTPDLTLPKNLSLVFQLPQTISVAGLAVGDPVTAVLRSDVKREKTLLLRKGAIASGRITRIQKMGQSTVVGFLFTDLDWPGGHTALKLIAERGLNIASPRSRVEIPQAPNEVLVVLGPGVKQVNRGMLFYWRTDP